MYSTCIPHLEPRIRKASSVYNSGMQNLMQYEVNSISVSTEATGFTMSSEFAILTVYYPKILQLVAS